MANTTALRLIAAASLALALPLAACGSSPVTYVQVCVGPEDADDLEDLFDRDTVVHDPSRCNGTDSRFSLVSVEAPAPPVGEELEDDGSGRYRRTSAHRGSAPASRASTPSPGSAGSAQATSAPKTTTVKPAPKSTAKAAPATKETRRRTGGR